MLGLIAERRRDTQEARRRFSAANREAPDDYPAPVHLSAREFDGAVEAALIELPTQIREYLSNVAITVEDVPALDDLMAADPPLSPSILGLFRGSPLGDKASMDPWSHFPSSIVLYQKNLQRLARDHEELLDEIRTTLVHEVGHFLGFDEEDLWERGLD
jgi:predicted Zn-dependent protease with MMP-like domain